MLTIVPFRDEREAVRLANSVNHGGAPKPEDRERVLDLRTAPGEEGGGTGLLRDCHDPFAYSDNASCPEFCPRIGESNLTLPAPEWLR